MNTQPKQDFSQWEWLAKCGLKPGIDGVWRDDKGEKTWTPIMQPRRSQRGLGLYLLALLCSVAGLLAVLATEQWEAGPLALCIFFLCAGTVWERA